MTLFRGDFVHFPSLGEASILRDHLLAVDDHGYISHFETSTSDKSYCLLDTHPSCLTTIATGSFVMPSFCDLHLHAPQYLYQGTGLDLPLMEWLFEYAYKAELRIDSDPQLARRVYARLAERLLELGTGAVMLFGTIKTESNLLLAEAMQNAGLRAFVGKLSMDKSSIADYSENTPEESLAAARDFIARMQEFQMRSEPHLRLVEPVITPRFVPTCSGELLYGLGELAEHTGARVQSHLAEAYDQVAWVRKERGKEDYDVFDESKLNTSRTVQAHCTYLSQTELERLSACRTAVAHCPLSNAYFSARPFPLREALSVGVRVGLGTDIAGGYSPDIMSAMRWAVGVARMRDGERVDGGKQSESPRRIDWVESMYLATRGGAKALDLTSGVFVVGAPFDAQCIRLFDPKSLEGVGPLDFFDLHESTELDFEMIEKWWCIGDVQNRAGVWIQGKSVGIW
ncbi:Metallo-dependent hydrolase [Vararia minispora EC-137]|uniref:Metallo-dependent hydrolase n=1 Tax=Vararia minispora EC-137 TaxID=1314806 RepID=A0ACB8QSZ2_9AGAM|nr:Metallo-dependent hydrolase [Vararia minispora EC-137]